MVKAIHTLGVLKSVKILVIGDFMLDTYTVGSVNRISPEAPVPILHIQNQTHLPGGAGNVVLNLQALGAQVIPIGRIGDDDNGAELAKVFDKMVFIQQGYRTPGKNRLISGGQQIIRVDHENHVPLSPDLEKKVLKYVSTDCLDVSAIAISDYKKGMLTESLLSYLIEFGIKNAIPVIVDPKGDDFTKYRGAKLIKPNLSEAYLASKLPTDASIDEVGRKLMSQTQTSMLMITRSAEGISLFTPSQSRQDFPVKSKEVKDVTGAGDTVLAVITFCLANNIGINETIHLANIAAGIVIEKIGCNRITLKQIAKRILEGDHDSKILDESYLFVLMKVLKDKKLTLVGLKSESHLSSKLFSALKKISSKGEGECLMVMLIDDDPNEHYVSLLSSLQEVDYLLYKFQSFSNLCKTLNPEKIYLVEGEGFIQINQEQALLGDLLYTKPTIKAID